jgi:hypothetical protein
MTDAKAHNRCANLRRITRPFIRPLKLLTQAIRSGADRVGISAEKREMPIGGLDRPKLGIRNEPPLGRNQPAGRTCPKTLA